MCQAIPMHQLTRRGKFIGNQKAAADFVVERRILFEPGRATLAAFLARYKKAMELGASDEGPPGARGEGFYAGYFRDPDGNKLNAFFMG